MCDFAPIVYFEGLKIVSDEVDISATIHERMHYICIVTAE